MTPKEIETWLHDHLNYPSATTPERTAYGWIMSDIDETSFEYWLRKPEHLVVDEYIKITDDLSQELVDQYKFSVEQDDLLDLLDIEQTPLAEPTEIMQAFKSGMVDILRSLSFYFSARHEAIHLYNEEPE